MNDKIKITLPRIFVFIAFIFGVIAIVLTPVYQVPDEAEHFLKAYVISRGDFIPDNQNGVTGYQIPTYMISELYESSSFNGNRDYKEQYSSAVLNERLPKDNHNTTFYSFSTVGSNFLAHIIPAIGIVFGKIIGHLTKGGMESATYLIYYARFFNLLFYIGIMSISLKIIPILKKTLLGIALFPMSITLAASVSYDALIISLCTLSISLMLKLILDDGFMVNTKKVMVLASIAGVISAIKPNYILIYILMFLIPQTKFNNKRDYIINIFLFITSFFIVVVLSKIPGWISPVVVENINSKRIISQQTEYIIANPFSFFRAMHNTFFSQRDFFLSTTIGVLGRIDTYLPSMIIYMELITVILVSVSEVSQIKYKISKLLKISTIIIAILIIVTVFFAMYWTWTPFELGVGSELITGVQGRYFIPVLILLPIVFSNGLLNKNRFFDLIMKEITFNSIVVYVAVLVVSSITLLLRFWV